MAIQHNLPGPVALFGSGETSSTGGAVFEELVRLLPDHPRIAILETPAGFQPNSALVAGRVADFLRHRLQNYHPSVTVVPARRRAPPWSTDDPGLANPLAQANLLFLGPGSPTYAIRHLQNSLAWHMVVARHRQGAAVAFASAACIATGELALPVYEIYKAGDELHWCPGLDFFADYGLRVVFLPHWNNAEGGAELDTSRCFMGAARFAELRALLPPELTVVGIDEHTVLRLDLQAGRADVAGKGGVSVLRDRAEQRFAGGETFGLSALGPFHPAEPADGRLRAAWQDTRAGDGPDAAAHGIPDEVAALVEERANARRRRDWAAADALRDRIAELGWLVQDTPDGPQIERKPVAPGRDR